MRLREVLSASPGLSFLICQIGEWVRWWMLRSLQFMSMKWLLLLFFLHYPDLQNRQLPPGMWFLHFGREMAQGNQELGLPASPTDRRVSPGAGKGRRREMPLFHFWGGSSSEWGHTARAEGGIMQAPGLPNPVDAWIPPPCNCLAGLRSKHLWRKCQVS